MTAAERRAFSRARRALDYITAHPIENDSFAVSKKELADVVAESEIIGQQEKSGQVDHHSGVEQRDVARARIRRTFIAPLVRIGQKAAVTNQALVGKFAMPSKSEPNRRFLINANNLVALAGEFAAVLGPLGAGDTFVADFTAALKEFESLGTTIDTGRGEHIGAAKQYGTLLRDARRVIAVLDAAYRAAYADGDGVLEGWIRARRIEGPFTRSRDDGTAPGGSPPPPAAPPDSKAA